MSERVPILTTNNIHMAFAGVDVLKGVSLSLYPGEVHGLVGENGAGKSTLAKIIAGVHHPTAGEMRYQNRTVHIPSPHVAMDLGIALIHQEPLTFPDLDVAENIFAGRQPRRGRAVNWSTMYKRAQELLSSLGVHIDPRAKVRGMSIADQQMIEMAAALSQDVKVVLMDEPTASLTPSEVAHLFTNMRRLRDQGVAIVFISHRLEEVFEICDRLSVRMWIRHLRCSFMLLWPTNGHMPCLAVDAPASVKIDKEYIRKGRHDTLSTTSKSRCRVEILVRDVLTLSGNPEDIIRWTPIAREEAEHVS